MTPGHVFVVPGDLTHLAADAWLLPTDRTVHVTDGWYTGVPGLRAAVADLGDAADDLRAERTRALALPTWPADSPRPVLVAVPHAGITDPAQVTAPLTDGLRVAAQRARSGPFARRRGVPLVALPAFGSAGGGGDRLRGQLLHRILDLAGQAACDHGVDVALVLRDPADLALAHGLRRDDHGTWAVLGPRLRCHAQHLARIAGQGRLVPFLGAGVSVSAGLPTWTQLLERLLAESTLPAAQHAGFRELGPLDQAHVLRRLAGGDETQFRAAVAAATTADRYGLAPALLAGLPTTEAVTLNYDTLYEMACRDTGRDCAVLPQAVAGSGQRWLLKLHGTVDDPTSIVLTREDYLGYGRAREALSALAKAMLLTRHLLFVGFGLADDHFHELVHDVRQVLPATTRQGAGLGTALLLSPDPLRELLWGTDLDLVPVGGADVAAQARRLEIFLDCLLGHADRGLPYFLDDRYDHRLTGSERRLRDRLQALADADAGERGTDAWRLVATLLESLGGEP